MQFKNAETGGSHRVSYLTPSKRPPTLLTKVTKPEKINVEKLSPLFRSSSCVPVSLKLTDVCQSVLDTISRQETSQLHDTPLTTQKNATIKGSKHEANFRSSPKVTVTSRSNRPTTFQDRQMQTNEIHSESQKHLNQIESEIITSEGLLLEDLRTPVSEYGVDEKIDRMSKSVPIPKQQQHRTSYVSDVQRSHSTSVCSSCSGEDSLAGLSRSSVCDGCSSSGSIHACAGHRSTSLFPMLTNVPGDGCNICSFHRCSHENLNQWAEDLVESQMSVPKTDASISPTHEQSDYAENDSNHHSQKSCLKKLSLTNQQLIFLLLRLILSRYKNIMDSIAHEQKTSQSQRLTIACLIQAVLVLARRCHSTNDQWYKMQTELRLVQIRHEKLQKRQRKIYVIVCVLVMLNVLNFSPVKQRVLSCFRFFGIVETIKKINRTRRMIADNWRNIPLLLTDFWRIFIFRSNIKRNV